MCCANCLEICFVCYFKFGPKEVALIVVTDYQISRKNLISVSKAQRPIKLLKLSSNSFFWQENESIPHLQFVIRNLLKIQLFQEN